MHPAVIWLIPARPRSHHIPIPTFVLALHLRSKLQSLHTAGVTGSIPVPPTSEEKTRNPRGSRLRGFFVVSCLPQEGAEIAGINNQPEAAAVPHGMGQSPVGGYDARILQPA